MKNSVFSVVNENSASLLHVNIDLSLFRCQPSPEFLPVATALTKRRKEEAENGQMRYTALKLGCLFRAVVPNTPMLIRAYGTRVSEIISDPDTNPTGREEDGPFKDFVGADGRSIWAAATSGPGAIATYLLACMLANTWKPIEATGIWVEIVRERKKKVMELAEGQGVFDQETIMAAQQEISRSELQTWDASARAWLRRAAERNHFQSRQFSIIADNVSLPWTMMGTTYERVTKSWVTGMRVLENLLNNLPQQATDRAVLHAISSWHLYPDLLVFRETAVKVPLRDELFPSAGVLSLGIEYIKKENASPDSTTWSLALSHLRHYGDPVIVKGRRNQQRLAIDELWFVVLGSILQKWMVSNRDLEGCIRWFKALGDAVRPSNLSTSGHFSWLWRLCNSCSLLLRGEDQLERNHRESLVKYGWRRGECFLGRDAMGVGHPFFGLCNVHVMSALAENNDIDRGITYLRSVCGTFKVDGAGMIVWYSRQLSEPGRAQYHELVMVRKVPLKDWAQEQSVSEEDTPAAKRRVTEVLTYVRWIYIDNNGSATTVAQMVGLRNRKHEVESRGEICYIISKPEIIPEDNHQKISWEPASRLFADEDGVVRLYKVFESRNNGTGGRHQKSGFTVWAKNSAVPIGSQSAFDEVQSEVNITKGTSWLQTQPPPEAVLDHIAVYLRGRALRDSQSVDSFNEESPVVILNTGISAFLMFVMNTKAPSDWMRSLRAVEITSALYEQMPSATVSPRIIETPLHQARWMPDGDDTASLVGNWTNTLPRENLFSCIAMFDSGRFNLSPDDLSEVTALGSEDSLFVSDILFSDPASCTSQRSPIRHLVGNTGHAGMVMLISPMEPRVRSAGYDPSLVQHLAFDGIRRDNLAGTSLHLSFTDWKMPLDWEMTGEIDQEIFLLESVVSVQQAGRWIADIDVTRIEKERPFVFESNCDGCCATDGSDGKRQHAELGDAVSMSSWDELLDPPPRQTVSVFHARDNWVARLAAVSILCQKNHGHCIAILPATGLCWRCFANAFSYPEPHIPQYIID